MGQTGGCQEDDEHFWEYDPILDQWSQIATLPTDIIAGSVTVATSSANTYLFGDFDFDGNFLKDIWHYNIASNLWDSIGQMPGLGRCYSSFWGFDSLIIGGGGETSDNNTILTLGNDFYLYSFSSNQWNPVVFLNSFDSTAFGSVFTYNKRGYYFGGVNRITPNFTFSNNMWSFDASKYLTDTSTGIKAVNPDLSFKVYPNPLPSGQEIIISTSLSGDISFSDDLGQVIDERRVERDINRFTLNTRQGVLFYRAKV